MLKKIRIPFFVFFFFLTVAGSRGEAFVPQTPHLLHLMVGKIKEPAGMVVHQVRRVPSPDSVPSAETLDNIGTAELAETLTYLFPGKLRAQADAKGDQFYVVSDGTEVRVDGGRVVSLGLSPFDHYTDVLLYRDHETLSAKLGESGVNTQKVTFQRLDGRICFFIGQPPLDRKESPGLWIDKEDFFPVRYLMKKGQWMVDVRYDDWQRISRTWYPMSVRIFVDGRAFAAITVNSAQLDAGEDPALFDVDRIVRTFPHTDDAGRSETGHEGRVKALDKALEEFNKLFD